MKIDNNTYFNIKDIDNVQMFGDIFLDYPEFKNVEIIGFTYEGRDADESMCEELNKDKALVQLICLNYLESITEL